MTIESFEPVPFGPYTLEKLIAVGGMAEIFVAKSRGAHGFEKRLVIKRMLPTRADVPEFIGMFIDEARVMMHLNHPKIVQVLDFGEVNGQYFIAMEYVDGIDCWQLLKTCAKRRLRPPLVIAINIVSDVLDALDYAHNLKDADGNPFNIVHRDVTPSNVFISNLGEVKLSDFGIATIGTGGGRNESGIVRGKYGYLAPEVVTGGTVDRRSDVFSCGILLAELLMVQRLFYAKNYVDVLLQVRDARLDRLDQHGQHIPSDLRVILEYALARNPALRYQTAGAFRDALQYYLYDNNLLMPSSSVRTFMDRLAKEPIEERPIPAGVRPLAHAGPVASHKSAQPDSVGVGVVGSGREGTGPIRVDVMEGAFQHGRRRILFTPPPLPKRVPAESPGSGMGIHDDVFHPIAYSNNRMRIDAAEEFTAPQSPQTPIPVEEITQPPPPPEDVVAARQQRQEKATPPLSKVPDTTGDLSRRSLISVLFPLAVGSDTGLLMLRQGKVEKEIYLVHGDPVYVGSNLSEELFGQYLLKRAVLTQVELDRALSTMHMFDGKLGETLVALKLLRPMQMLRLLTRQVRQKVLNAFLWETGTYFYYKDRTCDQPAAPLGLDAFELIEAGVRELPADALMRRLQPMLSRKIEAVAEPPVPPEIFRIGAYPREVYDRLKGERTMAQILNQDAEAGEPDSLLRMIYLLLECGLARLSE